MCGFTGSLQLDVQDGGALGAQRHDEIVRGVVQQLHGEGGVSIGTHPRDAEVAVVVGECQEFGLGAGAQDGSSGSGETPGAPDGPQDRVALTHAGVTLCVDPTHGALVVTTWSRMSETDSH